MTRLSPSGGALSYSTYLGGSSYDVANAIALDTTGAATVCGETGSINFPTTLGGTVGDGTTTTDNTVATDNIVGNTVLVVDSTSGS